MYRRMSAIGKGAADIRICDNHARDILCPLGYDYFAAATEQITVMNFAKLNSRGIEAIRCAINYINQGLIAGVIDDYCIESVYSGPWFPSIASQYYTDQEIITETYNNRRVIGTMKDEKIMTSIVMILMPTWCITIGGSIYVFGVPAISH